MFKKKIKDIICWKEDPSWIRNEEESKWNLVQINFSGSVTKLVVHYFHILVRFTPLANKYNLDNVCLLNNRQAFKNNSTHAYTFEDHW